jgi:hypothetical protein
LGLCAILVLAGCNIFLQTGTGFSKPDVIISSDTTPAILPTATISPTAEISPASARMTEAVVSRGDLHIHTVCSDGHNTYEQMVQAALAAGLDFIAITDHFWCPETIAWCKDETRLVCFPGKEISQNVHIVAVGISSTVNVGTVKDVVSNIHKLGGIAIAAHPYREDKRYSPSLLFGSGFDAMECNFHQNILLTFDAQDMPCVWDSDAHEVSDIGEYPATTTACDMPIKTIDDLKTAIVGGHCQPGD